MTVFIATISLDPELDYDLTVAPRLQWRATDKEEMEVQNMFDEEYTLIITAKTFKRANEMMLAFIETL